MTKYIACLQYRTAAMISAPRPSAQKIWTAVRTAFDKAIFNPRSRPGKLQNRSRSIAPGLIIRN
jgi:hypothetical protein